VIPAGKVLTVWNHRGPGEHKEGKKRFFSLYPICSLWRGNVVFGCRHRQR